MHRVGIGPDAHRWESCKPLVRRVQPKLRGFANPHGHATFRDRDCLPSSHVAVVQTRSLRGAPRCASGGPMTERPRGRLCSSLPASGTRSRHRGATSAARLLVGSMLILLGAACSSSATLREATSTRADGETYGFGHVTKLAEITVKKVFSTGSLQGPSNHIPSGSSPSPRRLVRLSEGSSVSSRTAHWPVIS